MYYIIIADKYKIIQALDERKVTGYKFDINSVKRKTNAVTKGLIPNEDEYEANAEDSEVSKVMGFGSFGRTKNCDKTETKNAKKFDIEKMMSERPSASKWKPMGQQDEIKEDSDSNNSEQRDQTVSQKLDKSESVTEPENFNEPESDSDDDLIGPPLPPGFNLDSLNTKDESDDSDEDLGEEEELTSRYAVLPISHEVELIHGSKSVTALALDPNGSRAVSGGIDYELKYWDFQGMDSSLQSFRSITPCECHPIKNLEFSSNGDTILVISGACVAKIVDRDGFVKGETIKGDQYISDMGHTKGHVAMLNDGVWNPREKEQFATSSNDGTCRLWSVDNLKAHNAVIKPRSSGGLRAAPNTCRYTRNAEMICCGCNDGSIQMWDTRRSFVNTTKLVRSAHATGSEISCLQFSYDGHSMLSRSTDDTMKLWDMKMLKTPVFIVNDLYNRFSMTDCFFSPDDQLVATGVSCQKGEEFGRLLFYSKQTSELKHEMKVNKGSVIRSSWHPKLNQLLVSSSNGAIKVYYDPNRSDRGAKLCVVKQRRKHKETFEQISAQIIARKFQSMVKIIQLLTVLLTLSARITPFQD